MTDSINNRLKVGDKVRMVYHKKILSVDAEEFNTTHTDNSGTHKVKGKILMPFLVGRYEKVDE